MNSNDNYVVVISNDYLEQSNIGSTYELNCYFNLAVSLKIEKADHIHVLNLSYPWKLSMVTLMYFKVQVDDTLSSIVVDV